jgi:hypothetical protein
MHTQSLVVMGFGTDKKNDVEYQQTQTSTSTAVGTALGSPVGGLGGETKDEADGALQSRGVERPIAVVEQRVSNLLQGAACLVMMTGPFLKLLHWVPKGVLAGLFVRPNQPLPPALLRSRQLTEFARATYHCSG